MHVRETVKRMALGFQPKEQFNRIRDRGKP